MSSCCSLKTPVGFIRLAAGQNGLISLSWGEVESSPKNMSNSHLLLACEELTQYFSGRLQRFTAKVDPSLWQGFSAQVIAILRTIPYGETITYGELALLAGQPRAARAVGRIMARNPLPLIVPCHRVIAANGAMTGYSGGAGITTKIYLLQHEKTA